MGEWIQTTWGDVITLQRGFDITKNVQVRDGVIPVVSSGGTSSYHDKAMADGPGVVIGRKGTLGRVHYVAGPYWPHDTTLWVKEFKGNVPRFVYYALQSIDPGHLNVGSASPTLNRNHVHPLPVRWPVERSEQAAIATVLGALDDKITADERVIEVAESLMVNIVAAVDRWESLSGLARHSTVSIKPEQFDETVAHFSLPAFDAGADPELVGGETIKSNKFVLAEPCVLFSKLNPRIPRIWNVEALPCQMALASTEFVVLIPRGADPSALWATLAQPDVSGKLRQMVAGTSGSHQRIRPQDLLSVQVRDVRALDTSAADIVSQLGQVCYMRRQESRLLARTRDELLPLLMSGKLRVKDAENLAAEAL